MSMTKCGVICSNEGVEVVGLAHREGRSQTAEKLHLLRSCEVGLAHREGRSQTAQRDRVGKMIGCQSAGVRDVVREYCRALYNTLPCQGDVAKWALHVVKAEGDALGSPCIEVLLPREVLLRHYYYHPYWLYLSSQEALFLGDVEVGLVQESSP